MSLHQFLKDATRERHNQAEGHPFQGALAQGKLPYKSYCSYLIQLRALHEGVESALQAHSSNAQIASVMRPEYNQLPFIDSDLDALKVNPSSEPVLPCVQEFCALPLFHDQPVSLIGPLYVLLGSKHGAKFIAHNVKTAYSLDSGFSYFDPYGGTFMDLWKRFTGSLNELSLEEAKQHAVLAAANETFDAFGRIGAAIWDRQSEGASVRT